MRRTAHRGLALFALISLPVLWPATASAHPLGNFTVNHYSGIHVAPGEIRIDYVIDMAEIPTFQEMPSIDTDGDGAMSSAEGAAWAEAEAPKLVENLALTVDGRPVRLEVRSATTELRDGQGGLPILRFEGLFAGPVSRTGRIAYRDGNDPDKIGWREITAVGEDGEAIRNADVPAESVSEALLSYPEDLLSSPLHVTSMRASFAPGVSVGSTERPSDAVDAARPGVDLGAFASLVDNHGIALVLVAFALALAFGAWHALLPGHGKTLMAAYMVGSETKVRQAVAVGSAVALMHTASVLGLGLLVITLEQTFRPESLYPWLGLLSGVVAIGLGAYLMIGRLAVWSDARRAEAHELAHAAGHDNSDEHRPGDNHEHGHEHGLHDGPEHGHVHGLPDGVSLTSKRGLLALALAGGILPSPSALIVMLGAINAHRVGYGIGLILAFSVGLALALMVVGLGALRARAAITSRLSSFWGRLVPVISASTIVGVGVFLAVRGAIQI
jgi:nickel/cobalt transporter (NicO) family protein